MKANEFVKKYGIVKVSKLVIGYPNTVAYKFYNYDFEKEQGKHDEVCLVDLKRLIESYKLVESCGGLDKAKEKVKVNAVWCNDGSVFLNTLKQAIEDVESCL